MSIRARMRALLLIPGGAAVAYALAWRFLPNRDFLDTIEPITIKTMALLGCVVAAHCFDRGDHLRRAWYLYGLSYLFIDLISLSGLGFLPESPALSNFRIACYFLSNIFGPIGAFFLARTWLVAGLELPGAKYRRLGMLAGFAVGMAMAGHGIYGSFVAFLHDGKVRHLIGVVMGGGDTAALIFIAPIVLTAFALRGGLIGWVWLLLAASTLSWLLFDMQSFLPDDVPPWVGLALDEARILACTFAATAGLAQRIVVQ
jgi:hypothetical protein